MRYENSGKFEDEWREGKKGGEVDIQHQFCPVRGRGGLMKGEPGGGFLVSLSLKSSGAGGEMGSVEAGGRARELQWKREEETSRREGDEFTHQWLCGKDLSIAGLRYGGSRSGRGGHY